MKQVLIALVQTVIGVAILAAVIGLILAMCTWQGMVTVLGGAVLFGCWRFGKAVWEDNL